MNLGYIDLSLMDSATATQVSAAPVDARGFSQLAVHQTGSGTITGGIVLITGAPTQDYSGTWNTLATLNPTAVSAGATERTPLDPGAYAWVRAEITSAITGGGDVSVRLVGC